MGDLTKVIQRPVNVCNTAKELKVQILGGDVPPSDPHHPGRLLLDLGWKYTGPETAKDIQIESFEVEDASAVYCWQDPQQPKGTKEWHTLAAALAIAFRRYIEAPTRLELTSRNDTD